MKLYELTYLISSNASEDDQKNLSEKTSSLVQKEGGVLKEIKMPIRLKLLQPVKQEFTPFSVNMEFYLNTEKISLVEAELRSEPKILRYLLTAKKILKAEIKAPRRPLRTIGSSEGKTSAKTGKKVELKEIEEKLEEILK